MTKRVFLTSIIILAALILGFLLVNDARAQVAGCGIGPYNVITGQLCPGNYNYYSTQTTTTVSPQATGQTQTVYAFRRELSRGARGEDVAMLQQILKERNLYFGRIDGIYGSGTRIAVWNYQLQNGITPTGRADSRTLNSFGTVGTLTPPCNIYYVNGVPVSSCTSAPAISTISGPQSLAINQQGAWTVSATDSTGGPLTYSVVWGDQPGFLYGSAAPQTQSQQTANFTHTYTQAGIYTPKFTVTNIHGLSASTSITVNVGTPQLGLNITTTTLPDARTGVNYTSLISASGGTGSYSWSLTSGVLPPGLSVVQMQCFTFPCQTPLTLSGTPTTAGSYNFTISVSSGGQVISKNFTLVVNASSSVPQLISVVPSSGSVGTGVNLYGNNLSGASVFFGGYPVPINFNSGTQISFSIPADSSYCPPGLFCTMQYRPITPGNYNIYVTTANGTSNVVAFTVTAGTSATPYITSLSPTFGRVGSTVTIYGTGFTATGNRIKFGDLGIENSPSYTFNSSGSSVTFTVPYSNYNSCWASNPPCSSPVYLTQPGTYPVSVINGSGISSNTLYFTVTN